VPSSPFAGLAACPRFRSPRKPASPPKAGHSRHVGTRKPRVTCPEPCLICPARWRQATRHYLAAGPLEMEEPPEKSPDPGLFLGRCGLARLLPVKNLGLLGGQAASRLPCELHPVAPDASGPSARRSSCIATPSLRACVAVAAYPPRLPRIKLRNKGGVLRRSGI